MKKEAILFFLLLVFGTTFVSAGWFSNLFNDDQDIPALSPCTIGEQRCNPSSETIQECVTNGMTGELFWQDFNFCISPGVCELNADNVPVCNGEPECTTHVGKICYGNEVRWYDSCNTIEDRVIPACVCTPQAGEICWNGNIVRYDHYSCDNSNHYGSITQVCPNGCLNGESTCLGNPNTPTDSSTCEILTHNAGYSCWGDEIQWYDICTNGQRENTGIRYGEPCQYGCNNGAPICNTAPNTPATPTTNTGTCSDPDSAVDGYDESTLFEKGTTTNSNGDSEDDSCPVNGEKRISEKYCQNNIRYTKDTLCPGQTICQDGECVNPSTTQTSTCTDSDSDVFGFNEITLFEKGTTTVNGIPKEDECKEDNKIYEYYCQDASERKIKNIACPGQTICQDGKCACEVGTRSEEYYCSTDNTINQQKSGGQSCIESYECITNNCDNGQCTNIGIIDGFLRAIFPWLFN